MQTETQHDREVRAARNQSLFRAVNERLKTLNETFASASGTFDITCECADIACAEIIGIHPHEYLALRSRPRRFAVRPDHVLPDVERVVSESGRYIVVEKTGAAGDVVESLAHEA